MKEGIAKKDVEGDRMIQRTEKDKKRQQKKHG